MACGSRELGEASAAESEEQAGPGMQVENGKLETETGLKNGFLQGTMLELSNIKELTVSYVMVRHWVAESIWSVWWQVNE